MRYDDYVSAVQRGGAWGGGIVGGLLAFAWAYTTIGLGAGIVFGACGAFAGTLVAAIVSWLLVPHVLVIALCVMAAAALPFVLIWLAGLLWRLV
jgi:hypothetical protein